MCDRSLISLGPNETGGVFKTLFFFSGAPSPDFSLLSLLHITVIILDYITMGFSPYIDRYMYCCRKWFEVWLPHRPFSHISSYFLYYSFNLFQSFLGNHHCLVDKVYMYYRSLYILRPYKNVKMWQRNSRSQVRNLIRRIFFLVYIEHSNPPG